MVRTLSLAWPLLALLAGGCASHTLEELRAATPKGTPFQARLATHYLRLAEDEKRDGRWESAARFADKGLQAAYGSDPAPEEAGEDEALTAAREALLGALSVKAATVPEEAAQAQYSFDCWAENAKNGREADAADCREGYSDAMHALARVEEASETEGVPAEVPEASAYIVFFGFDKDTLDAQAARMVEGIVKEMKQQENYTLMLNGHTDTMGESRYNMQLSWKRSEAVMHALVAHGVPEAFIQTFGFGESDPRVPTPDETPEPGNRRVEIYIGDR